MSTNPNPSIFSMIKKARSFLKRTTTGESIVSREQQPSPTEFNGVVMFNLLTSIECQKMVEAINKKGFNDKNLCQIHDTHLGTVLWSRVLQFLPKTFADTDKPNSDEQWELTSFSNEWRVEKLTSQCCAQDSPMMRDTQKDLTQEGKPQRTFISFVVYLISDGFEGGNRLFFKQQDDKEPAREIWPSSGTAMVYKQGDTNGLYYKDLKLEAGQQYMLKSDILYTKEKKSRFLNIS
mmetsp:Transcript_4821/g.7273  ORF Transcript_4821/g.7273 Transcript_4821/m.7273 type:complete len:235 (+) Transcript_4821:64-768(+)